MPLLKKLPLIWTRASTDWEQDALLLAHYQGDVIHIPCLTREFLSPPTLNKTYQQALVTSSNALTALQRLPALEKTLRTATFHCFGSETHIKLTAKHYKIRHWQVSSAQQLCTKLLTTLNRSDDIAVLTTAAPAFPLTERLQAHGCRADKFILYRTVVGACWANGDKINAEERQHFANNKHLICFASPSAVEGFYQTFQQEHANWSRNFSALAIGATTAQKTKQHFAHYTCSEAQTLASLLTKAQHYFTEKGD